MTELRQLIVDIASNTKGVLGLVISDKDGVPVLKTEIVSGNQIVDGCFRNQFLSVYGSMSEHAAKMCLGSTLSIMSTFDDYQVVHCNHSPLVLTVVATREAMTGQIMSMSQTLKPLICDMAKTVMAC